MLPVPCNPTIPRRWLRPPGAAPHELLCGLVVDQRVRWLMAIVRRDKVEFSEFVPCTSPARWQPAPIEVVRQAEKALLAELLY